MMWAGWCLPVWQAFLELALRRGSRSPMGGAVRSRDQLPSYCMASQEEQTPCHATPKPKRSLFIDKVHPPRKAYL